MPNGKTKFQEAWLLKELDGIKVKEWCGKGSTVFSANCLLCGDFFDTSNSGFSQVKSHHKGKKHQVKFQARFCSYSIASSFSKASTTSCQQDAGSEVPVQQTLSHEMQVKKAEAIWAMNVANNNMSFKSCNETLDLFKEMFPDSRIAKDMQLKEKKVAYTLVHGLAPHFENLLKQDIRNSDTSITVAFDETTNIQMKRQLDVHVRYWSAESNEVSSRYITSIFMGHATADHLLKELLDVFSCFNIPLEKILCFSMDGPNVNRSFLKKINEVLETRTGKKTLDIGFCNLHVVHNSFKKLLQNFNFDFDELATDMFYFLKNSAARREDYKAVEEVTDVMSQFLMKHVSSRWLTVGPVAERIFQQLPNLKQYFLNFLPKQKTFAKLVGNTSRYLRIRKALKCDVVPCYIALIIFIHKPFEKFLTIFQNESPMIHLLYLEANNLLRSLMSNYIKDSIILQKEGSELKNVDLKNQSNWKPLEEIEIGTTARKLVEKLKCNEKKSFLLDIRGALISTSNYLKINLPFCNEKLHDLQILRPCLVSKELQACDITRGLHSISHICSFLHFSDNLTDIVRDEWKLFQMEDGLNNFFINESDEVKPMPRIDHFWRTVFELKDTHGNFKYSNLAKLIKASLTLPHGNSDPERGFSINNALLMKDKCSYNESTIKALRIVKGSIKHHEEKISSVPITKDLLISMSDAHKKYLMHLEKLKEEELNLKKRKLLEEKQIVEDEKRKKLRLECESEVSTCGTEIIALKTEKETALVMIKEGTERIAKAMKVKNNKTEVSIAHNLISQGSLSLVNLEEKIKSLEEKRDLLVKKQLKLKFQK